MIQNTLRLQFSQNGVFLLTFDAFRFCVGFLTLSVSVTCICMFLAPHNNIHSCVTTLVQSAFHSYWSRGFHPCTCMMVPRFPVSRFPPPAVRWSRVFQSRVVSRPPKNLKTEPRPKTNFLPSKAVRKPLVAIILNILSTMSYSRTIKIFAQLI